MHLHLNRKKEFKKEKITIPNNTKDKKTKKRKKKDGKKEVKEN